MITFTPQISLSQKNKDTICMICLNGDISTQPGLAPTLLHHGEEKTPRQTQPATRPDEHNNNLA